MEIINKKLEELKPYENNPRLNDESVELVANSIKEFGFKVPIVIDKDNVIIAGHTRYKASQQLGLEEVPCIVADDLTPEQVKAFRLADNKVGEKSEWYDELLDLEMMNLDFDFELFGFDEKVEEPKEKKVNGKSLESMELKSFEHYDYLVFVFKNEIDWLRAVNEFGIKKVDAGYGKQKKVGVGRVVDGKRLLEKI